MFQKISWLRIVLTVAIFTALLASLELRTVRTQTNGTDYDTFSEAAAPQLKKIGPVYRAVAPSYFTFGSHAAMFVGFTPGVAGLQVPYANPKYAKIFKILMEARDRAVSVIQSSVAAGKAPTTRSGRRNTSSSASPRRAGSLIRTSSISPAGRPRTSRQWIG